MTFDLFARDKLVFSLSCLPSRWKLHEKVSAELSLFFRMSIKQSSRILSLVTGKINISELCVVSFRDLHEEIFTESVIAWVKLVRYESL